jgi:hypothetical protein
LKIIPENGGSRVLCNIGICLPNYTASQKTVRTSDLMQFLYGIHLTKVGQIFLKKRNI